MERERRLVGALRRASGRTVDSAWLERGEDDGETARARALEGVAGAQLVGWSVLGVVCRGHMEVALRGKKKFESSSEV